MLGSPLQYESQKAVLLHMDANTRFRISLHMPSIRSVEKVVPVKINHLAMGNYKTKVNDTSYQVGIIRHYPDGNAPELIERQNGSGGIRTDFDEFGFESESSRNILLAGDVSLHRDNTIVIPKEDTDEDEIRLIAALKDSEKALAKQAELRSKGMDVNACYYSLARLPNRPEYSFKRFLRLSSSDLCSNIDAYKLKLLSFDCRRNTKKPPFTCYIQLTIRKGGRKQIHQFEYNKKLYEAIKHLNGRLFDNGSMPIRVENLNVTRPDKIYRLPTGFRLQVHKAHVSPGTVSNENLALLVANSNTLDRVWMNDARQERDLQNQVVRNAKRLVIVRLTWGEAETVTNVLADLPNLEISILPTVILPENYVSMIEAWLARDRPVGASLWMRTGDEATASDALELVWTQFERIERSDRCVIIRKADSTPVEVFYMPFEGPNREKYNVYPGYDANFNWILKIRILEA